MIEDEKFQNIFDELQKIQKIEEQNDIIRFEIKQQSQTIDEIKSETGIEENSKTGENEPQVVDNSKISYGDNNVIINIELGNQFNNETNVISTVLGQITSKEREIAAKINESNLILGEIIKTVGNIGNIEGVTESDVYKIVKEQVEKVDKKSQKRFKDNAIKINKVSNELSDMKNQTQPYVSVVPQQMLGFS